MPFAARASGAERRQIFALVDVIEAAGDLVTRAARQRIGQRRFAGPVRPHDRMHFARADGQVQSLEDFLAADGDVKVFDLRFPCPEGWGEWVLDVLRIVRREDGL
jgi:hypothetical protein